jgi:hypothetical protein
MSNIFKEVINDPMSVEEKLLGPTYPYYKNIKPPGKIGMSDKGTISQLGKDIDGLQEYVKLLVAGNSKASVPGGPLGNKFFLKTGAKCKDSESGDKVDRYIYVNNIPDGSIPFVSSGTGVSFSDMRGIIPGTMGDLKVLNPFKILQSFMSGATPPCEEITLETVDNNNNSSSETHYLAKMDIRSMPACDFEDGKNPITKKTCKDNFVSRLPDDHLARFYFFGLSLLVVYIIHRVAQKTK